MTSSGIISQARKKVLELTTEIVSDDDLYLYGNQAKDEIAKRLFSKDLLKQITLSFSSGSVAAPSDFESFYNATDQSASGGTMWDWMSNQDFDNQVAPYMLTYLEGNIKVYPTSTPTIYLKYWKKLVDFSANVQPTLDSFLHDLIVDGIVWRALEDLQEFDLSTRFLNKFESRLAMKASAISQSEEKGQRGGSLFNYVNLLPDIRSSSSDPNRF